LPTRDAAYTVLGGSVLTALGFSALATSSYLNSNQLDTGTFLRLWTATILVLALGFVVILAGFLMASRGRMRRVAGGILGVIASFACAFVVLILITTTAGITPSSFNNQEPIAFDILLIGTIISLFVGFPLSMFGSVPAIVERERENESSEITS
jgi:MFS family permease